MGTNAEWLLLFRAFPTIRLWQPPEAADFGCLNLMVDINKMVRKFL